MPLTKLLLSGIATFCERQVNRYILLLRGICVCVVVILTGGLLVAPAFAAEDGNIIEVCNESSYPDDYPENLVRGKYFFHKYSLYSVGVIADAVIAVYLIIQSRGRFFRNVTIYTVTLWLYAWLFASTYAARCLNDWPTNYLISNVQPPFDLGVPICTLLIVQGRVVALEKSMMQPLGSKMMRHLLYGLAFTGAIWMVLGYVFYGEDQVALPGLVFDIASALVIWWFVIALRSHTRVLRLTQDVLDSSSGRRAEEAQKAASWLRAQMIGIFLAISTFVSSAWGHHLAYGQLWPLPAFSESVRSGFELMHLTTSFLDNLSNLLMVLLLSGAFTGGLAGARKADAALERLRGRRTEARRAYYANYRAGGNKEWHDKVYELAGRAFTLEKLLEFYAGLGRDYMLHFDSELNTTADVVRGAIIPLSRATESAYASVMMGGVYTKPSKMCTHNWGNLFRDLVAAITADALQEVEYDTISRLLDRDVATLQRWVKSSGHHLRTYWVCAFSVNQHTGICGANPYNTKDSATQVAHATCDCKSLKHFTGTHCEMNKFHQMMMLLAMADPDFEQLVAIDAEFSLFTRAWCVMELAAANEAGMKQKLVVKSGDSLAKHEDYLRTLRIEDMEASRPEDKDEILANIADKEDFNERLQILLFKDLFPSWRDSDSEELAARVGRLTRWQQVCNNRSSVGIYRSSVGSNAEAEAQDSKAKSIDPDPPQSQDLKVSEEIEAQDSKAKSIDPDPPQSQEVGHSDNFEQIGGCSLNTPQEQNEEVAETTAVTDVK